MTRFSRTLLGLRRAAHAPATRLAWFSLCALFVNYALFDTASQLNEFRDAQVIFSYEDVAARTVRKFGEWPLWNPYYCGGLYALGTPQGHFAAPPFLLSVLFGTLRATPLIAFVMSILGMEGFYRYTRRYSASALGPALVAPLFAANGFFAYCYFGGWINFYGFQLIPWVLFGVDGTARGRRYGPLITAASFTFIVGFGGTYAGPMAALLALVHAARVLVTQRATASQRLHMLGRLALAALLAVLLSAFRMWPVVESLIAGPRVMAGAPSQGLASIPARLFEMAAPRGGNYSGTGQHYVGWALLPLLALGLFRKRSVPALLLLLWWLWTATGYLYQPFAPFAWLRELPVFSTLRYPQRFLFLACFAAYEIAALGVDAQVRGLRRWRASPARRAVPGALLVTAIVLVAIGLLQKAEHMERSAAGMYLGPAPLEREQPFRQARGNRWLAAHYPPLNLGSLSCWEAYPVPMSPRLRSDLPAEEYLVNPQAGSVRRTHFSPNRLELSVHLSAPGRLRVNQNYHPGWKSNLGKVVDDEGLLAVDLPAGQHRLALRFLPRSALFGAGVSLLGLLSACALAARRNRLGLGLCLSAPLLVAASFAYDEPWPERPTLRNADGSALVVEALAPHAKRFRADFALPVTLEGAELPQGTEDGGASPLALYFRVHGSVPRSVGVSVHLESNQGRVRRADHQVIGASVYLNDAPRGVLLRDAFRVALGSRPGEHWKVYVSLWHAEGDRSRVPLRALSGATAAEQRVLVGEF